LIALGVTLSFGGTGEKELFEKAATARARIVAAENRRALEAYEKRNAEITPWVEDTVPANTENAALLYYQACLLVPVPDEATKRGLHAGAEPTIHTRTYLGHCLPVIEMLETASRIPACVWALSREGGCDLAPLREQISLIADILLVDAQTLAVDGHYRVALERCLTVRRIARHLANDPELMIGTGTDALSLYAIRSVLGIMPPDAETLTWLRGQFAVVPGPCLSYANALQRIVRIQIDAMETDPERLGGLKNVAVTMAKGEQAEQNIRNLTAGQFLSRAREGLGRFVDSIFRILDSEATHKQKLDQMKALVDEKIRDDAVDPIVKAILSVFNVKGRIDIGYTRGIMEHEALVNGTKAAVEVYLVLAKTGRLPEKLPDYLPKDPFTGRDFGYEITDEGFAIRCRGEEFVTRKKSLLEFKVRK
jgi:hypothetical protein